MSHVPPDDQLSQRDLRWREEAAFFDQWADEAQSSVAPIDPLALQRYLRTPLRRRFNKEFRFHILGDLRGKTVLDVGCGDGRNAVLLAKLGAHVVGIDIAPAAIQLANKRAAVNGLSSCTSFVCSPLEIADFASDSFDIIWGDAILHHLIPELPFVLSSLVRWAKPSSTLLFAEPINLNRTLRKIRQTLPIHTEATPGERPLEASELQLIRAFIPDLTLRPFSLLARLDRFILTNHNFERSSVFARQVTSLLTGFDYGLLSLPFFRSLAGQAVMYGRPNKECATLSTSSQ